MCLRAKPYHLDFRVDSEEAGPDKKEQFVGAGTEIPSRIADTEIGRTIAMRIDPDREPIQLLEEAERA
jgi:hypothetical protein